ncbi:MAG: radical SAM protein, partial [Deltaproteobacteria bacterium]
MRKKVVLVKPPERSYFNFGTFSLGVLASAVRDKADVTILDATDLSTNDTVQTISSFSPHILGITAMGLTSVKPVKLLIEAINRNVEAKSNGLEDTLLIVGGHGASMAYKSLLEAGAHAVVIGEGEVTFQSIVTNGIETGKEGMACMNGNDLVVGSPQTLIRPLDRLGFPARDLMPSPPGVIHLMETSRGCPHSCGFCETTRFYGKTWRPHSPERVATEVNNLVNEYNAWIIHFADDNFAANQHRVIEICKRLKKGQLPAFIMVSARADDIVSNPDMVQEMASARILRVSVGVETL